MGDTPKSRGHLPSCFPFASPLPQTSARRPSSQRQGSPISTGKAALLLRAAINTPRAPLSFPTICCLLCFQLQESPDIICREEFRSLHGEGGMNLGSAPWGNPASQAGRLLDTKLKQ